MASSALIRGRDEENQLGSALDRVRVLEESSDHRQTSQTGNLTNVDRVGVDENSTDHRRTAVWYQNLRLSPIAMQPKECRSPHARNPAGCSDLDVQQDRAGFRDLRSHGQLQSEAQELHRDRVVDVGLNRNLCAC